MFIFKKQKTKQITIVEMMLLLILKWAHHRRCFIIYHLQLITLDNYEIFYNYVVCLDFLLNYVSWMI